jgi:hypothetical protein
VPMARPRWFHHDGRPYDDFDFGKTRFYDELDAELDSRRPRERVNPISRWLSSRKGTSGRKRR